VNIFLRTIIFIIITLSTNLHAAQLVDKSSIKRVSPWGKEDQAGSSNRITKDTVLRALSFISHGKIVELSFVHQATMPIANGRSFKLITPSFPTGGPSGQHDIVWNDEYFSGELGHMGTQFDSLSHIGQRVKLEDGSQQDVYYNGFTGDQLKSPYGVKKLGVEHIKPFVANSYLIDISGAKGLKSLPENYEVTMADVRLALSKQGIKDTDIQPGDAVFFNYGWWRFWPDKKVLSSRPGINNEIAMWLVNKKISLVGSDNSTDRGGSHAVHFTMMVEHGILNLEFMNYAELISDNVSQFTLFFSPLRLKGATGSPARPIAIY